LGGSSTEEHTSVANVAGDQITRRRAGSSCESADDVIRGAIDGYAYIRIGESDCSSDIRANEVALDRVVGSIEKVNAAVVRGNNVAGISGCAADEVVRAANKNASVCILEGQGTGEIGADEIALNRVSSSSKLILDAFSGVSRDQITRRRRCAANGVVR
jgi:hypothetical protein